MCIVAQPDPLRMVRSTASGSAVGGAGMTVQRGFAYIALMVVMTLLVLTLGMAAEEVAQRATRERETQLLFVGKQFRQAIGSYYEKSPQGNKQFPRTLDDLIDDRRFPKAARHLRKIYADPMRDSTEWGLVRNEQGLIMGVYSLSDGVPVRTHFDQVVQQSFGEGPLMTYADWKFIYKPVTVAPVREAESGAGASQAADAGESAAGAE